MARPSDLTPELADRVAQLIRAGNWPETAAVASGISERTLYRWLARGQQAEERYERGRKVNTAEEPFWQFWQSVKRAERESEAIAVSYLMKSMPTAPTATIAWLERRFRDRWTRSERTEVTRPSGVPIEEENITEKLIADAERISRRLLEQPGVLSITRAR